MAVKPTYDELEKRVKNLENSYAKLFEANEKLKLEMDERKFVESALDNERRQLLSIFDSIDQPVYVSDPDTHELLYANEILKASFGDVLGRKCYEALQNMDFPCPFCTNDRIFGENAERQCIWEFRNRTTGRWFHCIDKAIAWPDGRMVRYEMAIDITERKLAVETLERFFDVSPDMICIADLEGIFRFVNPAFEKVLGYSREELTSTPYIHFVHQDDQAATLEATKKVKEGLPVLDFENRYRCKGGTYRWLSWRSMPVPEAGVTYAIARDVTERKEAEEALRKSESSYRSLAESLPGIVYRIFIREDNRMVLFNDMLEPITGYAEMDLVSGELCSIAPLILSEDREDVLAGILSAVRENEPFEVEYRIRHKDGDVRYLTGRGRPIRGADEMPLYVDGVIFDDTERKRAELALQESEQRYHWVFDSTLDGLFIFDSEGIIEEINPAACSMHGYSAEELIGSHGKMLVAPESHHLFDDFMRAVLNNQTFSTEASDIRKDGSRVAVDIRGAPIHLKGRPHLLGVVRDITERKQTEEAIQFKNTILSTQQEASLDGIIVVDREGKILSFNQKLMEMWGIPSEVIDSGYDELAIHSVLAKLAEPEEFLDRIRYLYDHPGEKSHEEIALVDGRTFDRYSAPMLGPERKYYGRVWYFRDITERKSREARLKESEQRYRAVVEDMPAMVCRFLPDGTLTFVNSAYCKYFGKNSEDLIGQNFLLFNPDDDKEKVRHHFVSLNEETPMTTYEYQVIASDGTVRWQEWTDRALFDDKGRLAEYQSIGRDISETKLAQQEREKMEKQLQQVQKMEAIGTLAGGIAHDFNNILGAIIGYSDLALGDIPEGDPVRYHLEQILQGGYRARDLVKQILAFSRQTEQEKRPVRIGPIVKETAKLLRASLPATIEIETKIRVDTDLVVGDPTQIHQVMMNLCTNAGHAMRERGGILRIGLHEVVLDAQSSPGSPDLNDGSYLRIEVSDTGHGIFPEILERIFDPYFTTKEKGDGTGLGLAVVHGIIKNHGGAVRVYSEPGKGTTFHVFLPRVMAISEHKGEEASTIPGGNECVLFVDDEVVLTNLAQSVFERLGYEVVTRTSSIEALEVFRSEPDRFDIVITDHTMPNLTGVELARKLMEIRPGLPIILCTGFSEQINPEKAKALGFSGFLLKPLLIPDLSRAVRRALSKDR